MIDSTLLSREFLQFRLIGHFLFKSLLTIIFLIDQNSAELGKYPFLIKTHHFRPKIYLHNNSYLNHHNHLKRLIYAISTRLKFCESSIFFVLWLLKLEISFSEKPFPNISALNWSGLGSISGLVSVSELFKSSRKSFFKLFDTSVVPSVSAF